MHGGAAKWVDAKLEAGGANSVHVDDVSQITDIRQNKIFLACALRLHRGREGHAFYTGVFLPQKLVGTSLDHSVTSVSAGPPLGGLYLKPPSSGGLCEGVTTIPSAKCSFRPRL